ncbi:class I SAM-dependent methyltransferase [Paraburkholderia sediminicola]|uniref:class I SAM-dependent methyltransferase n=1 Tax=Paraburkholderia sediminicola TaxID=458836 RepID=UPI0038BA1F99
MNDLLSSVARYYSDKIQRFGNEPRGVDWNGHEGQVLRFAQLCKVLDPDAAFSVTDVGCGYGSLLDFLGTHFERFDYVGVDISDAMIHAATQLHADKTHARFQLGTRPSHPTDFAVASGIFNVKLDSDSGAWRSYIESTLENMHEFTTRGFAFNCLTGYSDQDKMRADLHYADPCELFDICKRKYSRNVALLHDYGLYEFTILVRK